ncbi:ATP-dependent rRNA helicase spb4 [Agyrium rufum]|nr:ATP-dependent rRNA helicase spb4 [Agyrium rufum]
MASKLADSASSRKEPSSSRSWGSLDPSPSPWILDAVSSMGMARMTPVQASTIPLFMGHKDVVVEAVTGSGKTLAFLVPVVERLLRLGDQTKKHHVGAIIVSPTRELAGQIHSVVQTLLAFHGPSAAAGQATNVDDSDTEMGDSIASLPSLQSYPPSTPKILSQLLVGGSTTPAEDLNHFLKNSPNLLISTPGRLLELLSSPHVHCPQSSFEVLVLDEADRLLDLGFKDDLQKILGKLPKQRRTGLFSASMSEALDQIIRVGLRNPVKISVKVKGSTGSDDQRTPASLRLTHLVRRPSCIFPALSKLLTQLIPQPQKTIVYLSTCAAVDYFQHVLPAILPPSFDLVPLHGKHPPHVRTKNFATFSNSTMPSILLTTDVAARGLDIPSVDLVVQVDPPSDPKVFLHRCGRAGRAGRRGLSVIFLTPGREEEYVRFLDVRRTPVVPLTYPLIEVMTDEETDVAASKIRKAVLSDRALYDKAQRAFVSWVRAYSKHQAGSIFRVQDLDWEERAKMWGLLRMPKMPECKTWQGNRSFGLAIDFSEFAYKDRKREIARREKLQEEQESREAGGGHGEGHRTVGAREGQEKKRAWSNKIDAQEERVARREKKAAKRERERWELMSPEEKENHAKLQIMLEEVRKQTAKDAEAEEWSGIDG